ncbi:MAG: DoxX family protein [Ferruginibacter sp.]
MKTTKILYWVFTTLFAMMMLSSAIPDVLSMPIAVKGMHEELGYPIYFIPFIGVAKVLGVIAILIPGYPRLKEWAYAGLMFDLIGATFSIIAAGKSADSWAFMIIPLILAACSYIFYHRKLKATEGINREKSFASGNRTGVTTSLRAQF